MNDLLNVVGEPVAVALQHKNGLAFEWEGFIQPTLEKAQEMQRRHLGSPTVVTLYTESQLQAAYAKGQEDMRERAAKVCQKIEVELWARYKKPTSPEFCNQHTEGKSDGATECFVAIRALPIEGEQNAE